ncbi:MAG: glycerophosphodiester phosphodiesterase family protein [Rhodoglobus sp.]
MHDWTVDRTTNGTGPVWALSYNDIIRLDAGVWYAAKFAGTRVPTLEQLLLLLQPSNKSAILELKGSWNVSQARVVTALLDEYDLGNRVIMASFDLMTLRALREAAPEIARMVIASSVVGDPAVLAAACGAMAIVTSAAFIQGSPGVVERIHAAGLGVLVYTLNDETAWSHAIALGADGLITDRPETLSAWLAGG